MRNAVERMTPQRAKQILAMYSEEGEFADDDMVAGHVISLADAYLDGLARLERFRSANVQLNDRVLELETRVRSLREEKSERAHAAHAEHA